MNRWINPMFWDHPTPVNVFLIFFLMVALLCTVIVGGSACIYAMFWCLAWVSEWPWHLTRPN